METNNSICQFCDLTHEKCAFMGNWKMDQIEHIRELKPICHLRPPVKNDPIWYKPNLIIFLKISLIVKS